MNLNLQCKYGGNRHTLYKFLVIMKMIVLLLTTAFLQVSANTFAQRITLNKTNIPLEKVMKEIRSQSGYDFFYDAEVIKNAAPVTINVKDASIETVLEQCLAGRQLTYTIENKVVFIKEKSFVSKMIDAIMMRDIKGKVFDQDGNPLGGATVVVVGTDQSAKTANDGFFYLAGVNENATIRISYVGYATKELKISSDLSFIKLAVSQSKLDEVKVIAYGTTTERLSTGNVSTLRGEDIARQPVNNILDALAGRVAGLQITPTSGITGAAPKVLIRGQSSMGNATNTPLYLIDGVPVNPNQSLSNAGGIDNQSLNLLFGLNPLDIESISVLKDADATAIYGSRGSNGVILVTTKRSKRTGVQLNVNAYTGMQKVGHFMDFLDVHQYNAMRREAYKNDGIEPPSDPNDYNYAADLFEWDSTKTHDWQKEFIGKTAVSNDLNLSLSGGSETTHFYLSGAYHKEGTVMPDDAQSKRVSFLSRVDHLSLNKKFSLNVQAGYSTTGIDAASQDLTGLIDYAPDYPIYHADGTPNWDVTDFPLAYTMQKYSVPTKNYSGSTNLAYEFIPGLKAKINAGFNQSNLYMSQEQPLSTISPYSYNYTNSLINQNVENSNWIIEPQLEYIRNLKKHHFEILGGATFQKSNIKNLYMTGTGFANDALISNIGSASVKTINSSEVPYAYNAIFGRVSYNYNQEFLANATFRRDGSSRFGPDKKFGNFGALGVGWVFTQQKAVTDVLPFLSFGKIRASYGITGNDQITEFGYISTVSASSYSGGYNAQAVLAPTTPANPYLQWETNKKLEAGLELGFLKERIFLSASYFRNRSSNQLVNYLISPQAGFYYYPANFPATVENKGYELELTSHNLTGNFTWTTSFNLTRTKNTLISFPNIENSYYNFRYTVGQSLSIIKSYKLKGLSNTTGMPVLEDVDKNGSITSNDRVMNGNNDPFYGGLKNDFSYKGFSLSFFVQYSRYRGTKLYIPNNTAGHMNFNVSPYSLDRWQKPGDEEHTIVPAFTTGNPDYNYINTDQLVATANIFRLSNAAFSYSIPDNIVRKLKMTKLQVYVNAQNLYVWDAHKAYELDPQTGNNNLPPLRTIVFGINVTL